MSSSEQDEDNAFAPEKILPRDPTGSYLHLKLKRFKQIDDLSMPFAKRTWQQFPYDATVDMTPTNSRSTCRHCHEPIEKGSLRMRLFLQCHKGCKISAYFHHHHHNTAAAGTNGSFCFWNYPETRKLLELDEIAGWKELPAKERKVVQDMFLQFKNNPNLHSSKKKKRTAQTAVSDKSAVAAITSSSNSANDTKLAHGKEKRRKILKA